MGDNSGKFGYTLIMDLNEIQPSTLDPLHWGAVFATLSLDLVQPYTSDMALQLPSDGRFLPELRHLIVHFRALSQEDGNAESRFASAVFARIQREFKTAFAQHLYRWGTDVFQAGANTAASTSAFLWNSIICYGKLDGSRDVMEPPPFIKLVRSKLLPKTRPTIYRLRPVTAWDRELYDRHGYSEMDSPMELVQATVNYCSFVAAWAESIQVSRGLPDLPAVISWASKVAQFLRMPMERLGQPGSWKPLVRPWRE